ncbi:ArsR/SmtB family transcription factor [Streptosporangium carneum]|uniref:Transcriptional regulator n=1 Tax=Streptosporangium carneum TaxID=47481 RepID=A0A9W6I5E8_9ACTN|nr:helix-turn-helix domain-containing protein [Streptosporangium carneum]GLK12018.1 transcriptional regulator [Streptosporangium carneum]
MREPWHPAADDIKLAEIMHALADPVRLEIVARLAESDGESCADIGSGIDVHKSTMSHHYRVLREAGVTLTALEGRSRLVRLRRDDLDARFPGLLDSVLNALR